ncbi:MAG: F0F1 ATP synthase assembly protein I [Alphaproteobacteria bacterium PA2]|nr:MAG: F0F1 ATP synthase assembly protein I [Alphaproteobacteria bacterium PA2]
MAVPETSREEAIKSLDARAEALAARTTQPTPDYGSRAHGDGARLIGVLFGGAFVGIGFGAIVDSLIHTAPWAMIIGVLMGFAVSIWMAVRMAARMSAELASEWGPPKDLPIDDEDD